MKTYTKQDFHNPEQLTRQQVGENYRLLLHEELDGRFRFEEDTRAQYFSINGASWHGCIDGASLSMVYRVPLATPLPDGTVLSSNECCWSDQPRKKRVYCAGPMSSYPKDYNFPAFYSAAESLEKQGYEPVNPAQLDIEAGFTLERIKALAPAEFQEFLKGAAKRDLDALQQCDAIALLPGWESSKGAKAEKAVAEWLGLETIYLKGEAPTEESCEYCQGSFQGSTASGCVGPNGDEGELGSVDTGYSDHIKQPDADGWIPHTPGDPMPCDGNSIIDIIDRDGGKYFGCLAVRIGAFWSDCYCNPIVKWRPEKPREPYKWPYPPLMTYNSDERAEWDVSGLIPKIQSSIASDDPKGAAGALKTPMWLLPAHALQQTAWVHKLGAAKYGKRVPVYTCNNGDELVEFCTCGYSTQSQFAIQKDPTLPVDCALNATTKSTQEAKGHLAMKVGSHGQEGFVNPATIGNSDYQILITLNNKSVLLRTGSQKIKNILESNILTTTKDQKLKRETLSTIESELFSHLDYLCKTKPEFYASRITDAKFATGLQEGTDCSILTTTTKLENLEDSSAIDATKDLACSETILNLLKKHSDTCAVQNLIVRDGEVERYGGYNWRHSKVCATTYISAIMRHLDAWRDGEDNDPESGVSHIAHVAASCNILLDAQHCGKLNDDRAKLCQI